MTITALNAGFDPVVEAALETGVQRREVKSVMSNSVALEFFSCLSLPFMRISLAVLHAAKAGNTALVLLLEPAVSVPIVRSQAN